ncbi:MAG: hypothetical protein ACOZAM_03125 [Pseudomonadota bacterium]
MRNLSILTPQELLLLHAAVSEELRRRGVTRSSNNPVGDLAEHLFCRAFDWKQAPRSMRDADATDCASVRYQIKGRRMTAQNASRQLGALRDLPQQGFDVLAAVLFREDYRVLRAALIPHARVVELAKRVERTNSWRFLLREAVWLLKDVEDVTEDLKKVEMNWAGSLVAEPNVV